MFLWLKLLKSFNWNNKLTELQLHFEEQSVKFEEHNIIGKRTYSGLWTFTDVPSHEKKKDEYGISLTSIGPPSFSWSVQK
jgi:hypothetical protein